MTEKEACQLRPGDIVRGIGTGTVYKVAEVTRNQRGLVFVVVMTTNMTNPATLKISHYDLTSAVPLADANGSIPVNLGREAAGETVYQSLNLVPYVVRSNAS